MSFRRVLLPLVLCCVSVSSRADDDAGIGVRTQVSATTVKQGDTFRVEVVLTVRGQDAVDELEGPDLSDFETLGQSESSNASFFVRGGRRAVVVEHRRTYLLRADEPGTKQVGEVIAKLGEDTARAAPVTIRVLPDKDAARDDDEDAAQSDAAPADAEPAGTATEREPGARFRGRELPTIFLEVRPDKDVAVPGQQVGVVTEVWSQVPLGQYPRAPGLKPPGFVCLTLDDGERLQATQRVLRGRTWYVYPVSRDALFPLAPGKKTIAPLSIDVTPAGSFFSRRADVTVRSEAVTIDVEPLPEPAPDGFVAGNVGVWDLRVSARPTRVRAGEPFTLIVEASGVGNVDALTLPEWAGDGDVRVFPPTVRRERRDRDGVVAGRVVAETLIQKNVAGTVHVPGLALVTWSPDERRYVTRAAPPIDVVVGDGPAGDHPSGARGGRRVDVGQGPRPLALDIEPRTTVIDDGVVGGGIAAGGVGALAGLVLSVRRRRRESSLGQRRRRREDRAAALQRALAQRDLAAAQQQLLDALADRCGDDVRAAPSSTWPELLPQRGVSPSVAARAAAAVAAAESARYAPGGAQKQALDAVVEAALAVDAAEQREAP